MPAWAVVLIIIVVALTIIIGCPLIYLYTLSRKPQHAVIRNHWILGWIRYFAEKVRPEIKQYWIDGDNEGLPFSHEDFIGVVKSSKYRTDLISFGSKRDFEKPGYYISPDMFPTLTEELKVDNSEVLDGKKYVIDKEGLLVRKEHVEEDHTSRWQYVNDDVIVVGPNRANPWKLKGMFGASATSYGAVGENYILSVGAGARMAGGSWLNTGEGGVAPEHLQTGADVVAQIGPGLFGYRDSKGNFSFDEFMKKAKEPNIKAFELKFAQGAKIRGGHLEGSKVTAKVAAIRGVEVGKTVNSPNRFPFLKNAEDALNFVNKLQTAGGKPVGIKIVVGRQKTLESFFETMIKLNIFPDFITVDGGEGGSGATYKSMADSVSLPLFPALITFIDTAIKYNVRDKFKVFASGKLISADKIAIALAIGADAVNSARGFMMATGCIMAMQCHTGHCPVGVTTTDPKLQNALVPEEKQWRVMNYILTVRQGLYAISAACGLESPKQLTRDHVLFKNEAGQVQTLSELFPN